MQEAAFQLYRPIIARVIPPTPEPAKVDTKPEDGEVAAEEGRDRGPQAGRPRARCFERRSEAVIAFISSRLADDVSHS